MKTPLALLLLAAAATFGQAPLRPTLDKAALESYLRHMELWIPQVAVKISDPKPSASISGFSEVTVELSYNGQGKLERYYLSPDLKSIFKGEAYALDKNPFQSNLDKMKLADQPSFGAAKPKVDVVVYGDFQCPYCKAEAETLRANLPKAFADDVRVIFKDFPLESIHPWARAGSVAGRCVYRQDAAAFWKFHDWVYKVQEEIAPENLTQKVLAWAGENGVDAVQLGRCIETKATDAEVSANLAEGHAIGVDGTPTIVLNGRKLPSGVLEWPVLQGLITLEISHQAELAKQGGKQ